MSIFGSTKHTFKCVKASSQARSKKMDRWIARQKYFCAHERGSLASLREEAICRKEVTQYCVRTRALTRISRRLGMAKNHPLCEAPIGS